MRTKAEQRAEVAKQRAAAEVLTKLQPIINKQVRVLANEAGLSESDLLPSAYDGANAVIARGREQQPGWWRYAKVTIRGYMLNYLRDHHRVVRVPRELTRLYLAERSAARRNSNYSKLSDAQRAQMLNCTVAQLVEARASMALYAASDEWADRQQAAAQLTDEQVAAQERADLAAEVINMGIAAVATRAKMDQAAVRKLFAEAMEQLLNAKS